MLLEPYTIVTITFVGSYVKTLEFVNFRSFYQYAFCNTATFQKNAR